MTERFIMAALITYRLAYLVAEDEGPFSLFAKVRARIDPQRKTWVGRGVRCPVCVSFWLSMIAALFLPGLFVINWLALAGAVLVLVKVGR